MIKEMIASFGGKVNTRFSKSTSEYRFHIMNCYPINDDLILILFYNISTSRKEFGYDQIQDGQKEPSRGNQFTSAAETVARATNV